MFRALTLAAVLLSASFASATPAKPDLTTVDITTMPGFRADQVTVFGVALGMTHAEAEAVLAKNPKLASKRDAANPDRIYVSTRDGKELFYLIFLPGVPRLERISIFTDFGPYLVGKTRGLLTLDAVNDGALAKSFLGTPSRSGVTLDVPMAQVRHVSYRYDDKWLSVTHQVLPHNKVVFALEAPTYRGPANLAP